MEHEGVDQVHAQYVDVNQQILRLNLSDNNDDNDSLLLELAEEHLEKNTPLAFSYLFSLSDVNVLLIHFKPSKAAELFKVCAAKDVNSSERMARLACYYFSLEIFVSDAVTQEEKIPFYALSPDEALGKIRGYSPKSESGKELLQLIKHFEGMMRQAMQAQEIKYLDSSVDVARFTTDDSYKREKILKLSHSENPTGLPSALSLAEQYNVSQWEVVVDYIEWMMTSDCDFSVAQQNLGEKEKVLLENSSASIQRFESFYSKVCFKKVMTFSLKEKTILDSCFITRLSLWFMKQIV